MTLTRLADKAACYPYDQAEGPVNKLKLLKRPMFGRASVDLLRRRALLAA